MVEIFILVILSALIGIGTVQQEHGGLRGLMVLTSIITTGMLMLIVIGHNMTIKIIVFTISGVLLGGAVAKIWYMIIVKNKSQNNKIKPESKIDSNLSQEYQDAFKRGLNEKYPLNSTKDPNWVDQIRRNLQVGLKERYGELKPDPSNK